MRNGLASLYRPKPHQRCRFDITVTASSTQVGALEREDEIRMWREGEWWEITEVPVPLHDELNEGTLRDIGEQAG